MDMEPDIDNRNVKNLVLCYKNIKYTVQQGTFKKLFLPYANFAYGGPLCGLRARRRRFIGLQAGRL